MLKYLGISLLVHVVVWGGVFVTDAYSLELTPEESKVSEEDDCAEAPVYLECLLEQSMGRNLLNELRAMIQLRVVTSEHLEVPEFYPNLEVEEDYYSELYPVSPVQVEALHRQ